MKQVVMGTAGHIDHGKTTLVKALTGIDTDRLKEEKERGISIDLGFANLKTSQGIRIAFIDVPGHERFVRNMLAGVSGIDIVLLVVAADEAHRQVSIVKANQPPALGFGEEGFMDAPGVDKLAPELSVTVLQKTELEAVEPA